MSQSVGFQYKSRIPSFSDEASIVEALKVYHYGVDDYTTQPIPDDSVEGNFRTLNLAVTNIQSQLGTLNYVNFISQTVSPNIISGQSITTVPLTLKAINSQTSPLISFQNSSSVSVGSVSTGGFVNIQGYVTVGSTTQSTTTGINVIMSNSSHKGIVVNAPIGQSTNIQEWLVNGSIVSKVSFSGVLFSQNIQVSTLSGTETLTNKTLTSPTISGGSITTNSVTLSGSQTLDSFRARNIYASTLSPSDGNDGDLWVQYV